jgi:hypothetical protein
MNGLVNNEFYIPAASLQFAGTKEFLEEYQRRAPGLGIDPLGFTYPYACRLKAAVARRAGTGRASSSSAMRPANS